MEEPALDVVFGLARETLATYDRLKDSGWSMAEMPHEAEVRVILASGVVPLDTERLASAMSTAYKSVGSWDEFDDTVLAFAEAIVREYVALGAPVGEPE